MVFIPPRRRPEPAADGRLDQDAQPDEAPDDFWFLDDLDDSERKPAVDPCGYCRRPVRDDVLDRSVRRCGHAAAGGPPCGGVSHDGCLDLHVARCPRCAIDRQTLCARHAAELGFICESCRQSHGAACRTEIGRLAFCGECAAAQRQGLALTSAAGGGRPAVSAAVLPAGQTAAMLGAARLGNQGLLVRPGAVRRWKGFLFATESEAAVARAFDAAGVLFAPLAAVRLTGERGVRLTREADFLVVHDGVVGVLELDGRPHDGRAAYDHERDRAFKRHGVWVVERVPSADALRDPAGVVARFVGMLRYYRRTA